MSHPTEASSATPPGAAAPPAAAPLPPPPLLPRSAHSQPTLASGSSGGYGRRTSSMYVRREEGNNTTESWQDFLRRVAPQHIAARDPSDPVRLAYVQSRYEEARRRRRALTASGSSASSSAPSSGTHRRPVSLQIQDRPLPPPPAPQPDRSPDEYAAPRWQPDDEASLCPICGRAFGVFFRRHHCRKCGRVVCAACSPHRITIPRQFIVRPPTELEPGAQRGRAGAAGAAVVVDLTHDTDDDDEAGPPGADANPALGGGQEVRLCNPCVPDPNPLPPPAYLSPSGRHFAAPAQGAQYGVPPPPVPHGTHPRHHAPGSSSSRARARQSWAGSSHPYDIAEYSPGAPHPGIRTPFGSAPSGSRHSHNWPLPDPAPARPTSFFFARTPRTSSNAPLPPSPPPPPPPVREEDECPVCHAEMPAKGPDGDEGPREAHVAQCIASHFTPPALRQAAREASAERDADEPEGHLEPPSEARGAGATRRTASARRRTTGMVVYPASEKDCVGDDGAEQECVICFEEFAVGNEMGRLECLCKFHRMCIRQWWDTKGAGSCPVHQDGI